MSIIGVPRGHSGPTNDPYFQFSSAVQHERGVKRARWDAAKEAFEDLGPVVYYVWRHNLIKIGHTINLRQRMMALNVSPTRLLTLESGPIEIERQRHIDFVGARVHGDKLGVEHYWPTMDLMNHINDLRVEQGQPALMIGLRPVVRDTRLPPM